MAATHVVSLFLPNTLKFDDERRSDSKPPSPPAVPLQTNRVEKRASMRLDLPARTASAVSLFAGASATPPSVASIADDHLFGPATTGSGARHFAKQGDPRSLIHSDVEVPTWGADQVLNQPRSRAAPLPSGSILDFGIVHEQLTEQRQRATRRRLKSPDYHGSRNTSSDRSYGTKSWSVQPPLHGNGGLTNAMRAAAGSGSLDIFWVGTLGFPTDAIPHSMREEIDDCLLNAYTSQTVYISDKDLEGHYHGYCKTILWPIFHYQVPDHPKSKAYADHSWAYYENVNQAFAEKVVDGYKRGDTIWIHDYHLLLVPAMIRKKLPDAQIGFFLHTAFPSSEIFRCLAKRKNLLEGMLGANLIAFQTKEYVQHFLQTCSRLLTLETTEDGVQLEDRFVNITSQPIGINPRAMQDARMADEVQDWVETIQQRYKDKLLIVARDKLDNVHGVRQKLLAYELFLNKYPQWAGKTVLIQVATSTSEHSELLTTVSDICARIDNVHSSLVHQPLVFLKQDIDFAQYLALLTVADCLMNCSLRDGMNLIGSEYVVCQDGLYHDRKHGPLILSEFAGSAAVLHGQIAINPWDYHQMADALKQALEMNEAEKEQRWKSLHADVLRYSGAHWAEQLSTTLARVYDEQNQRASMSIPRLSTTQLSEKYKCANGRIFFVDYEGTLAPHKTNTGISLAQPQRIISVLNELMADPKNTVYVMSGRCPEELNLAFQDARGLGLIAENGCFLRKEGSPSTIWTPLLEAKHFQAWKKNVMTILDYFKERMEGSYVEQRHFSLRLRYEKVHDQATATRQAGDCADQINSSCKSLGIQAVPIPKAVLVEPIDYNKARATTQIFDSLCAELKAEERSMPDFLMVVGDDREDEGVFRWANDLGKHKGVANVFTVSVGKRNTDAQAALTQGSTGLLAILQKLAQISMEGGSDDYFGKRGR